jgi:hypothetical protein
MKKEEPAPYILLQGRLFGFGEARGTQKRRFAQGKLSGRIG